MKKEHGELWKKLQSYQLDNPTHAIAISKKLSQENHWDPDYTKRVMDEYKKFVFLAMTAGHLVVPSDEIDQVWHIHMLYSQEYWKNFCPQILGREFHHGPSTGGKQEDTKHNNWYKKTKETYKEVFGQTVPDDIWPSSHIRFHERFVRVSVRKYILIEKVSYPTLSRIVVRLLTLAHKLRHSKKSA